MKIKNIHIIFIFLILSSFCSANNSNFVFRKVENNFAFFANSVNLFAQENDSNPIEKPNKLNNSFSLLNIHGYIIIGLFIVFIHLFIFGFFFYQRKLKKEKEKQIKLIQDLNFNKQKALINQMNPHFFFNTLNSIQFYILKNDKVTSNKYLSMFSKLMRTTLENSQLDVILLSDEIDSLKTYIELEQLRFVNKFNYSVGIDPSLEINLIKVPPFIIQPFVENAIWHGLMHLENREGMLTIIFLEKNKLIECRIIDNGIGRAKSQEIKQSKMGTSSYGTKITEERIDLMNQMRKEKLSVTYIDHNSDLKTGTEVIIILGTIEN